MYRVMCWVGSTDNSRHEQRQYSCQFFWLDYPRRDACVSLLRGSQLFVYAPGRRIMLCSLYISTLYLYPYIHVSWAHEPQSLVTAIQA